MTEIVITSTLRESIASIAAGICTIWEADADTPTVYAEQARIHNIDLAHSVMAYTEDGRFVGIGVLAGRGKRGFVLDFGIAPPFRGQGCGHRLFAALVAGARQAGIRQVTLQVSADNHYAQQIYVKAGFHQTRELVTLCSRTPLAVQAGASRVEDSLADTVVTWYSRSIGEQPGWERELSSLLALSDAHGFVTDHGFILAHRSPYHPQVDAVFLALDAMGTSEDVAALCYAAGAAIDSRLPVALPDEPVNSPLVRMLTVLGFRSVEQAYEMELKL